jgi:puromycin-sensitive aminopeptidase
MQRPAISPPLRNGSQVPRFTLNDEEEVQHLAPGPSSHKPQARFQSQQCQLTSAPSCSNHFFFYSFLFSDLFSVQAAFEVDLEYTGDDDALLDWEQYSHAQTFNCCGRECAITPPAWWYQTSKRKRRYLLAGGACLLSFTFLLLILTLAAAAKRHFSFSWRSVDHACDWTEWRLPQGIAPTRYNLTFQVQMQEPYLVNGLSDVGLMVTHPTRCVVVHVADLVVLEARLGDATSGIPARRRYNEVTEQLTLEWDDPLPVGYSPIHMRFNYQLNDGMSGFYKSTYTLPDGSTGVLAATQFEANAARSAFPCFDEPEYKAEFAVEVITQKGLQVLSNMPARVAHQHEHQDQSTMTWHFEPSPPMSTYLMAIVIGDLRGVTRQVPPPTVPVPVPGSTSVGGTKTLDTTSSSTESGDEADGHNEGEEGHHDHEHEHGDHDHSTASSSSTTANPLLPRNVTVWSTPDQISNLDYAADAAAAILPAYEAALGTAYALPKLDLVAIPDFSAGAMENWGLITYRQTALLVTPTSSASDKRYVTKIVAHEMAHQWFGNLVTMNWWNDLWLNEGFASYFEFIGADAAHPEEQFLDSYYSTDVAYALQFDSKKAAHPMSLVATTVNHTDKIESLFDPVEYERGGAVLRMLRAYINRGNASMPAPEGWEASIPGTHSTESTAIMDSIVSTPSTDPFLAGLHEYLGQHKYNSTTAAQLWTAMAPAAGIDLPALMEAWTYQQGYPVLSVTVDAKGGVWVTQAPFSLAGCGTCESTKAWWVPVSFVSSEAPTTTKWAEINACQSLRPLIPALPKGGWVKVNARQYGYYRVNYSPELWSTASIAAAQRDTLTGYEIMRGVDYAGLIEDSYALTEAGMIDAPVFLETLKALPERPSTDLAPWSVALSALYAVDAVVPCQESWRTYVLQGLLAPFMANTSTAAGGDPIFSSYTELSGTAPAPVGQRLLRPLILRAAGYFGDTQLGQQATEILFSTQGATSLESLSPNVRSAVYQTAAHAATDAQAAYDKIKSLYLSATDSSERDRALRALGSSPLAVPAALEFALTSDVRAQDVPTLVVTAALGSTQEKLREAWEWYKTNWDTLHGKLGGNDEASRRLGQIMEKMASGFADEDLVNEVDQVYAEHAAQQSEPGYAQRAKESIQSHVLWLEKHGDAVCEWVTAELQKL